MTANEFKSLISKHKKTTAIVLLIVFMLYLQIFKIRFGTDLIIASLLTLSIFQKKPLKFLKDWTIPMALFFLYEYVRGRAHEYAAFFGFPTHVELLVTVERWMFFFLSEIPPVVIQYALKPDLSVTHWYDYILFFFYTSFFWFWLLGGFIIWTKKHAYFNCYMYGIVSMALFSAVIFILAPAAPPWYAANEGLIPEVSRVLWNEGGALQSNQFEFVSTYGRNPVAALPSNHVAWPTFTSIWLIFLFGWKRAGWVIIFPLLIAFATWYGGEHYVIDSLAGAVMAGGWFLLTTRIRHPEIPKQVRND